MHTRALLIYQECSESDSLIRVAARDGVPEAVVREFLSHPMELEAQALRTIADCVIQSSTPAEAIQVALDAIRTAALPDEG